jgi:hypothetical protein
LAEPLTAVAALVGLLASVLQEEGGGRREAEQAGSESREPRVEGGTTRSLAVSSCLVHSEELLNPLPQPVAALVGLLASVLRTPELPGLPGRGMRGPRVLPASPAASAFVAVVILWVVFAADDMTSCRPWSHGGDRGLFAVVVVLLVGPPSPPARLQRLVCSACYCRSVCELSSSNSCSSACFFLLFLFLWYLLCSVAWAFCADFRSLASEELYWSGTEPGSRQAAHPGAIRHSSVDCSVQGSAALDLFFWAGV